MKRSRAATPTPCAVSPRRANDEGRPRGLRPRRPQARPGPDRGAAGGGGRPRAGASGGAGRGAPRAAGPSATPATSWPAPTWTWSSPRPPPTRWPRWRARRWPRANTSWWRSRPPARRRSCVRLEAEARAAGVAVRVGFNLRCHPALKRAHDLLREDAIGPLLYLRGRYGHGGRPGYEREWRADPARAGGGELHGPGHPPVDLTRWLAGDIAESERAAALVLLAGAGRGQRVPLPPLGVGRRGLAARELDGVEEPLLASRSSGATGSCRSTASEAATGRRASPATAWGPSWARRRPSASSSGTRTRPSREEWRVFWRRSGAGSGRSRGLADAIAALEVVDAVYARAAAGVAAARGGGR